MSLAWTVLEMNWPPLVACVLAGWTLATVRYLRARRAHRDAAHDAKKRS